MQDRTTCTLAPVELVIRQWCDRNRRPQYNQLESARAPGFPQPIVEKASKGELLG